MSRRRYRDEERGPFDMSGFDEEFEEMREYMAKLMEQLAAGEARADEPGQFVYGFSMRMGHDGKPIIQRFGDTRALPYEEADSGSPASRGDDGVEANAGEREPLTDVIEDARNVCITVEIPGVEKKDIDLSVVDRALKIKVDSADRRYFKEVQLPAHVDPDSTKATYNNGVLDITLRKASHGSEKKIKIE